MKSDYPLILRFHNVTLGELKLCLSPFSMNVDYFCDVCKKPWQTNAHLDEVASIIEGMFEADRFVPLEVPKSVVRLRIDDQSTDIANLVNGSHIDTNMEKFLYGRIKRQKHKLKWTSKILETYVHGTNTGNFVPLEKYVQSMTLKKKTSTTSTSTRFVCSVKYIRHSDYPLWNGLIKVDCLRWGCIIVAVCLRQSYRGQENRVSKASGHVDGPIP
jgi:hypothetical protein